MADMAATPYQRQPVHSTVFPNHNSNIQSYGATVLEGYGMQGSEGLANIVDGQYYALDESQHANQMLEDGKYDAWSRDSNAVSGGEEDHAQTSIEEFFSLDLNPWNVAPSQSLQHRAHPHIPIAPQHDQKGQDYAPSSASPSAQQSTLFPLYNSQPFQYAPQSSSLSPSSDAAGLDEHELRRLRNTAASARFRVKKKLREQSLQSSSQQKREKLAGLKARVLELETENKWLKSLLMGKYDADNIKVLRDGFKRREAVQLENKVEVTGDNSDIMKQ